jgi:hypothetical protein
MRVPEAVETQKSLPRGSYDKVTPGAEVSRFSDE